MLKKWSYVLLTIIGLFGLAACSSGNESKEPLTGEELFVQSCASCHGADLKSGYAADLDQIGTKYTAEEIEGIIINGYKKMPSGVLKGEDAEKVAQWLAEQK
ncbi:cytochrome c [Caldibacillus lycopersici]|uniref:Cytochrome c n=1 Tax=Perspicuibacillus lycopersici TaxID=1325689 RepID=A0AAE3IT42_9BACI|nr:cytochrome c [Perspicuibacillus lycopersici]MCU9612966.1 cytochrome c [Perspicuibacillus lycopersici]